MADDSVSLDWGEADEMAIAAAGARDLPELLADDDWCHAWADEDSPDD